MSENIFPICYILSLTVCSYNVLTSSSLHRDPVRDGELDGVPQTSCLRLGRQACGNVYRAQFPPGLRESTPSYYGLGPLVWALFGQVGDLQWLTSHARAWLP